jgi:hypothetical protein
MTENQKSKNHHYVPRVYMKNFAVRKNNDYYIYAFPKNENNNLSPFLVNIRNICSENRLLTLEGNKEDNLLLENFYSTEIEDDYIDFYKLLSDRSYNTITDFQKKKLIVSVITMFYRSIKWINAYNKFSDEIIRKSFVTSAQLNKKSNISENNISKTIDFVALKNIQADKRHAHKQMIVIKQLEIAFKFIELIQNDTINLFEIQDDSEFITSDNPVLFKNIDSHLQIPFDVNNLYYLPINNKCMVSLFPNNLKLQINRIIRIPIKTKEVQAFNKLQSENCERFLLGTASALESYLKFFK